MPAKMQKLAKAFLALPVDDSKESDWYFDIRYIPFYPPFHLLNVCHLSSGRMHSERLVVEGSALKYFPETCAEATRPTIRAILRAFIGLGLAPRKIYTPEQKLAMSISEELVELELDEFWAEECSLDQQALAEYFFRKNFSKVKADAGFNDDITPPTNVSFDDFPQKGPLPKAITNDDIDDLTNSLFQYVHQVVNSEPPMGRDISEMTMGVPDRVTDLQMRAAVLPLHVVKARAEEGDPVYAFDYGMRSWVGLGCEPNRFEAYKHLVHAATSTAWSKFDRAIAHGILTSWHVPDNTRLMRPRDAIACAYHANESTILSREVSPPHSRSSPYTLRFMDMVYSRMVGGLPHIRLVCPDVRQAWEEFEAKRVAEDAQMKRKMASNPARYRCANEKCQIQSDTGKILSRCAGKCDVDKKPHYCSKACQTADWSHHKPYCKAGAESSVAGLSPPRWARSEHVIHYKSLDPDDDEPPAARGTFRVHLPNGDVLSSATLDPQTLKQMSAL